MVYDQTVCCKTIIDLAEPWKMYLWHMNHVMRKPVYASCEQQEHRLACTYMQSDQLSPFVCCLGSIIPLVSISEIPGLSLASVAEQASLSLTCHKPWKQVFSWHGSVITNWKQLSQSPSVISSTLTGHCLCFISLQNLLWAISWEKGP